MFELYKESIKITEENIQTPLLKRIYTSMKTAEAVKWCMYVFLVADRSDENPIKDLPELARKSLAGKIAFKGAAAKYLVESKEYKLALDAIKEYKILLVDKIQSDIDLYDNKMAQFIQLLTDTDPVILKNEHEVSGKVSYTTNIDIIDKVLENAIKLIIDKAIISSIKKSGKFVQSLRGSLSPNIQQNLMTHDIKNL